MLSSRVRQWLQPAAVALVSCATATTLVAQDCGPFTDVALADPFCPSILEMNDLGLTGGTSATTFGPTLPVTRQVLAAVLARATGRASSGRYSLRTALAEFWTTQGPQYAFGYGKTTIGALPRLTVSDGTDVWAANLTTGTVSRVRASDGKLLWTATGIPEAYGVVSAMGRVFAGSRQAPGKIFEVNPAASTVTEVATLDETPQQLAFDGWRVWSANAGGSVSIATPGTPWTVDKVTGFIQLTGILYDGDNIWVTDSQAGTLLKLNGDGSVAQTVPVGVGAEFPAFDGVNIWVPRDSGVVTVVRAATGQIIAQLTGNGLSGPFAAAYDGQRILVTNFFGNSVSLWNAADLAPIGSYSMPGGPIGVCSDGIDFFVTLNNGALARF